MEKLLGTFIHKINHIRCLNQQISCFRRHIQRSTKRSSKFSLKIEKGIFVEEKHAVRSPKLYGGRKLLM